MIASGRTALAALDRVWLDAGAGMLSLLGVRAVLPAEAPTERRVVVRRRWRWLWLALPLGAYLFVALRLLPGYRYQTNPDGVGYISVAQKWLRGDFLDAINAYWSPLYSWLLMPLLAGEVTPLLAAKILAITIGALGLLALWWLGENLDLRRDVRVWLGLAASLPLLFFAMIVNTPDLLMTVAVLFYLAHLTRPDYATRRFSGLITGGLMAVSYLAKAYALPFVVGHWGLVTVVELVRHRRQWRSIVWRAMQALWVLLLIVGLWSAALGLKYGTFSLGSTGWWNHRLNGPTRPVSPMHIEGLIPPPDRHAVSAWDDATFLPLPPWSPFESEANWKHQKALLDRNTTATMRIVEGFSIFSYALAGAAVWLAFSKLDPKPRRPIWVLASALWLYPCGYYLLHVEARFLSLMELLLLIIGAAGVSGAPLGGPIRRALAMLALGISFGWMPVTGLEPIWDTGKNVQQMADRLDGVLPADSRVASSGSWDTSLYLSAAHGWRYWGEVRPLGGLSGDPKVRQQQVEAHAKNVEAEVKRHQVEYFLVWGDPKRYPFLKDWPEVSGGKVGGLGVYRVAGE